jgi:putative drug exporter of the RND superfamily
MTAGPSRLTDSVSKRNVRDVAEPPGKTPVLARLGTWIALNPLKVIAVWIVLLVLAALSASTFTSGLKAQTNAVDGADSTKADQLMRAAFPDAAAETDFVVLHSAVLTTQDPEFRAHVDTVVDRYRSIDAVRDVISPYDEAAMLISQDGHTALVPVSLDGDTKDLQRAAAPLQEVAKELSTDRIEAYFTGYSPLAAASVEQASKDLSRAEAIGLPAAGIVLLLAFGSVVAAAIPLALGVTAIVASFGILGVIANFVQFNTIAQSAVTMLAIALGIDYSLFIVTRFREELAALQSPGREERAGAVGRALATAGHAVLFSGVTVMISLAGLFLVRSPGMRTMAVGMMAAVLAMMALGLTLLPAVLGLLGTRINSLALPWAKRSLAHPDPERSAWAKLTAVMMRRPVLVAVGTTALLGAMAMPALNLRYGADIGAGAVKDTPAGRGFTLVSSSFAPGMVAPINVVTTHEAGRLSNDQLDAIAEFSQRAGDDERVEIVASITTILDQTLGGHSADHLAAAVAQAPEAVGSLVDQDGDTTVITVFPTHAADTEETQALVKHLREEAARILGEVGLVTHIGGNPALIVDISAENSRATPLVIGAVLAASWLLLLFVFRSLLLPFKAIVMNVLSVGAAFGIVVLVFQEGYGADLLAVDRTGFIQIMLPLLTFAVAFGLSMDYEVFLLARMREEWERTGDSSAAVRLGITHTARVITSAAMIMVVVFAAFMLTGMLEMKQLGFMLALAVLLDATVVRVLLVPAVMRLMGKWSWWMPGWSRRPVGAAAPDAS